MSHISIVTICFNHLADLLRTCESIDSQSVKPYEHWIINGSTTPEIQQWILNTTQPGYRKWVNEPDQGIADAFNKGIRLSDAEIIHLLNAGDTYASDDVLETVSYFFETHESVQWVSGNIKMMRAGRTVLVGKPFEKSKLYRGMRSVSHPTWFVKKEVYNRVGLFKNYKIAMDYDLMCRMTDEPYQYLNKGIAVFDDSGISSVNYLRSLRETRRVYESYFGFSLKLVLWQLRLKLLYFLLQTPVGKWLFSVKKWLGLENW